MLLTVIKLYRSTAHSRGFVPTNFPFYDFPERIYKYISIPLKHWQFWPGVLVKCRLRSTLVTQTETNYDRVIIGNRSNRREEMLRDLYRIISEI